MDIDGLSPEERKRADEEVKLDPDFAGSRKMLLIISASCSIGLALVGLMLMRDMITMLAANVGIVGCVMVYLYFLINLVKNRKAAEARWMLARAQKSMDKKQRKADRKAQGR